MPRITLTVLLAIATGLPATATAQHGPCSLLTAVDVEAAAGGPPVRHVLSVPGRIAIGSAKDKPLRLCSWTVSATRSEVHVTLVSGLDGQAQSEVVSILGGEMDRLRRSGWQDEAKEFDGVHCDILTQGKATKPPKISSCIGAARNAVLLVDLRSQTRKLTPDEAKTLFDRAAARVVPSP